LSNAGESSHEKIGAGQIIESVHCLRLINGRFYSAKASVVVEHELAMYINQEYFATASLAGGMEREFVMGYLFGQGFITSPGEVESIDIEGNIARITAKNIKPLSKRAEKTEYRIVSGGGKSIFLEEKSLGTVSAGIKVKAENVYKAMNTVFDRCELYKETGGVHASGLFTAEAVPICIAEDIGRHNTLDKLIGYALINKIDFSRTFMVSTGRMASEMVSKICRANIPITATKTAVTKLGVDIGEKCGLTIIGFVKDKGTKTNTDMGVMIAAARGMKIYTHPERILF
jgi:FdhD protein